ncbi:MAG: GatB/YqeY domain-containing protein [Verrucomicrobiales bacterium]|nr:GatB/YqeY domain-containing protein [Verrucomicrobiales bacterium]
MSELNQQIGEDLKDAMRAKDATSLMVLRALKSAIKYAAIEKGGADAELDEVEALAVIRKQIKQRQDSVEEYKKGGRDELVEKESAEIEVLEKYLPAALAEDEVNAMIDASIAEVGATSRKEMGTVMKVLQEKIAGRADNKSLSQGVMQRLS